MHADWPVLEDIFVYFAKIHSTDDTWSFDNANAKFYKCVLRRLEFISIDNFEIFIPKNLEQGYMIEFR